jgi:hypothetical protein
MLVPYANACQDRQLSSNFLGRLAAWVSYRPECTSLSDDDDATPRRTAASCVNPPVAVAPQCAPARCAPRCASPRGPFTISLTFGWTSFMRGCPREPVTARRPCVAPATPSTGYGFAARACDSSFRCGPSAPPRCDPVCPSVSDGQGVEVQLPSGCRTPISNWFTANRAVGCGACGAGILGRRCSSRCLADAALNSSHVDQIGTPAFHPGQTHPVGSDGPSMPLHTPTPVLGTPRLETPPPPTATTTDKPLK